MFLHEISLLVRSELIMRPKTIVKSEVPILLRILKIKKLGRVAKHIDAELAVEFHFSSIEGSDSDTDLDTHHKQL